MDTNLPVTDLPRFEAQKPQKLAASYAVACVSVLSIALGFILGACFVVSLFATDLDLTPIKQYGMWGVPVLLGLYALVWLGAKCKAYAVREQDVSFYSGIVFRKVVVQPITRLQHIEVSRGAIERAFGLATLKMYSAGGALHSVAIPGLPVEEAEALRGHILDSRGLANEQ